MEQRFLIKKEIKYKSLSVRIEKKSQLRSLE